MAKKSPADLKKEGKELSGIVASLRKKTHNFAMLVGGDGIVLEVDPRKPPASLRKNAKAAGGGPKGAMGQMRCKGKIIQLTVEDDDVSDMVLKAAKKHFQERGLGYKFEVMETIEEDDEEEQEEESPTDVKKRERQDAEAKPDQPKRGASEQSSARVVENAPRESESVAQEEEGEDGAEEDASYTDAGRGPEGLTTEAAVDPENSAEDMAKELGKISDDLAAAAMSSNKGIAKKAGHLAEVLAGQIQSGDAGKAKQTLKLLQKTASDAKKVPINDDTAAADGFFSKISGLLGKNIPRAGNTEKTVEERKVAKAARKTKLDDILAKLSEII